MSLDRYFKSGGGQPGSAPPARKRSVDDLEPETTKSPDVGPSKPKVLKTVTLRSHHLTMPSTIEDLLKPKGLTERNSLASSWCQEHPVLARYVLARYGTGGKTSVVRDGWCDRVKLASNKPTGKGYLQVSYWGANHFALLHRVSLWADGKTLQVGEEASHRCPYTDCKTVGHVTPEDATANQARKNCLVWTDCPCGTGKFLICTHSPVCIKYCAGYTSAQDFLARGVCHQRTRDGQCLLGPVLQTQ